MIQFLSPVILPPVTRGKPSWMARWWRRANPPLLAKVGDLRTVEILDLIDRVRGAESQLARLKTEAAKCGKR